MQILRFQCITPDDIIKIIQKCPPKSCELDPLPSTHIKQHAETVAPTICLIFNISLCQGDFTEYLKQASVKATAEKTRTGFGIEELQASV